MMISIDKHKQPRALFFQLTISKNHPLKVGQLRAVWMALPNEVRLVPPAIIFVVPTSVKSSYKAHPAQGIRRPYKSASSASQPRSYKQRIQRKSSAL
jgi:hypothetical protein